MEFLVVVSAHGLSFEELHEILKNVCTKVFFQQSENGHFFCQGGGLPMGGKAASDLACLYCYAIESEYIDRLIIEGKIQEAKDWFNTWRFIDDLLGFGNRNWQDIVVWGMLIQLTRPQPMVLRLRKLFIRACVYV